VSAEIRGLIVRMAKENRDWGYTRIQGALVSLDYDVSRSTIASILREHGLEPAPERVKKTTWTEFLKTHWDVLAATDFFSVHVWTSRGLTRFACCSSSTCRRGASRSPGSPRSPTRPA
jgi:putative transposase